MSKANLLVAVILAVSSVLVISSANANDFELLEAAAAGDVSRVVRALDTGANIETTNESGATPLMWAALRGHLAVVTVLIQRGANVDARTTSGATALKGAAAQGHAAIVRFLAESGADLTVKDAKGTTPLDVAMASGQKEIATFLKDAVRKKSGVAGVDGEVISVDRPEQCLRIRRGPGTNHEKVGCAQLGEKLLLTGLVHNGWAEVHHPTRGWLTGSQIKAEGLFPVKAATASRKSRKASSDEDDDAAVSQETDDSDSFMARKEREADDEIERLRADYPVADDTAAWGGPMLQRGPIGIGFGGFR